MGGGEGWLCVICYYATKTEAQEAIGKYAGRADPAGQLLLSGYEGDRIATNFRRRRYYPLLERLGITRKPPHRTRHTFASRAVAAGVKPEHFQKILGHADYSVTAEVYIHADADELVRAVEGIGNGVKIEIN